MSIKARSARNHKTDTWQDPEEEWEGFLENFKKARSKLKTTTRTSKAKMAIKSIVDKFLFSTFPRNLNPHIDKEFPDLVFSIKTKSVNEIIQNEYVSRVQSKSFVNHILYQYDPDQDVHEFFTFINEDSEENLNALFKVESSILNDFPDENFKFNITEYEFDEDLTDEDFDGKLVY